MEGKAWNMKYLILASIDLGVDLLTRIGAILIKLISSPIQAENQVEEEMVISVPIISAGTKIKYLSLRRIKKKIKKWSIGGVWTH